VWQPQQKKVQEEIDELLGKIKAKELLAHCGNIKTHVAEAEQI
jgi:hypothetical protein